MENYSLNFGCAFRKLILIIGFIGSNWLTSFSYSQTFNCREIYSHSDITEKLQKVIDSPAIKKVIIPYMGKNSEWIFSTIHLRSNLVLVLDSGVVIEAQTVRPNSGFISIGNSTNVSVYGGGAIIHNHKENYNEGEWRHCISILSSNNVLIRDLNISDAAGDGIYINGGDKIEIKKLLLDRNARNGISIISCNSLLVDSCNIFDTGIGNNLNLAKSGPWAGIDFEPNFANNQFENIIIRNCSLYNNKRKGILFAFSHLGSSNISITIDNNHIFDNLESGIAFIILPNLNASGEIELNNNEIYGKQNFGILIENWILSNLKVNNTLCKMNVSYIGQPVAFFGNKDYLYNEGNFNFNQLYFEHADSRNLIKIVGGSEKSKIDKVYIHAITDFKNSKYSVSDMGDSCKINLEFK